MPHPIPIPRSLLAVAALGLALAGCHDPITAKPDVVDQYPHVTFSKKSLAKAVRLNPPTVTQTDTGNLAVSQPIRSIAGEGLDIEYKFVWLDKLGRGVRPEMTWRYKRLEPNQPDMLTASASSDEATDYQIQLRWSLP